MKEELKREARTASEKMKKSSEIMLGCAALKNYCIGIEMGTIYPGTSLAILSIASMLAIEIAKIEATAASFNEYGAILL